MPSDMAAELRAMSAKIVHRGPDDSGQWWDPAAGIGLAHRRLSILDLSAEGHQPMTSASGRYVVSYNGEIYNFESIRAELVRSVGAPLAFRGHSDTEVLLAAVEAWGIQRACERFVGMFAFALWDARKRELHLVRDRLGVKPLYYGWSGRRLLFGSELEALAAASGFRRDVDAEALAGYLRYGYVPGARSIYATARKVPPGTIVTWRAPAPDGATESPYWTGEGAALAGHRTTFHGSEREAADELERLLTDAVDLRMVSDVPLGAFLSGGVDSSVVVALMQARASGRVRTFSIGNTDAAYDEGGNAAAVARHLGTDHTAVTITPEQAVSLVPDLPKMYDEPFSDSSMVPTYLVSKIAREHVTVALSGDGGDELFGGYNRHVWGPRVWKALSRVPARVRRWGRSALLARSPAEWDDWHAALGRRAPPIRLFGEKLHKVARLLDATTEQSLYAALCSHFEHPESVQRAPKPAPLPRTPAVPGLSFAESMMLWDLVGYLPDDIMTKVDRASMAVSLEAREPLLDHRLVEFAWRLPENFRVRGGSGKWLLRQVLHRHVPRSLVDRPKMGFAVPIGQWLSGPLRPWVEELLDRQRLRSQGLLDPVEVRKLWNEHLTGRRSLGEQLWTIVAFQAWYESRVGGQLA